MNPLCLLTKGRTFKDMVGRPGAYKLLANSPLPKFKAANIAGLALAFTPCRKTSRRRFLSNRKAGEAPSKAAVFEAPESPARQSEPVKPVATALASSPFAQAAVGEGCQRYPNAA